MCLHCARGNSAARCCFGMLSRVCLPKFSVLLFPIPSPDFSPIFFKDLSVVYVILGCLHVSLCRFCNCHLPHGAIDRIFLQTSLQQKMGAIRLSFVSSGSCHVVGRECFLLGKHRQTQRGILLQKSSPKCSVHGPLRTRHLPVGFTQAWIATS